MGRWALVHTDTTCGAQGPWVTWGWGHALPEQRGRCVYTLSNPEETDDNEWDTHLESCTYFSP